MGRCKQKEALCRLSWQGGLGSAGGVGYEEALISRVGVTSSRTWPLHSGTRRLVVVSEAR